MGGCRLGGDWLVLPSAKPPTNNNSPWIVFTVERCASEKYLDSWLCEYGWVDVWVGRGLVGPNIINATHQQQSWHRICHEAMCINAEPCTVDRWVCWVGFVLVSPKLDNATHQQRFNGMPCAAVRTSCYTILSVGGGGVWGRRLSPHQVQQYLTTLQQCCTAVQQYYATWYEMLVYTSYLDVADQVSIKTFCSLTYVLIT